MTADQPNCEDRGFVDWERTRHFLDDAIFEKGNVVFRKALISAEWAVLS
jgi:hypothetical protein